MAKIAFCGAQCTGKTTLIHSFHEKYPIFQIQQESVRELKAKYGFDIASGDISFQLALLTLQVKEACLPKHILLDRTVLDSTAYLLYYHVRKNPEIPKHIYQFIKDMAKEVLKQIDIIVFLRPEFDLIPDGIRIVDRDQQKEITDLIYYLIQEFQVENKVIEVFGPVQDRMTQIEFSPLFQTLSF